MTTAKQTKEYVYTCFSRKTRLCFQTFEKRTSSINPMKRPDTEAPENTTKSIGIKRHKYLRKLARKP